MKRLLALLLLLPAAALAQPTAQTGGTTLIIPAFGEVTRANDEAVATFAVEEQDKDKATAASRVNTKMKEGMEILRRGDPKGKLQTRGYYTYAVYADEPVTRQPRPPRHVVGWRVGQYVDLTTTTLTTLPATVASAQRVLTLNGIHFRLSRQAQRELDRERIEAAYKNLQDRIAFALQAMGRSAGEAMVETVDFEGSGQYAPQPAAAPAQRAMAMAAGGEPAVAEPSFEPGETTLSMRVVGRVKVR